MRRFSIIFGVVLGLCVFVPTTLVADDNVEGGHYIVMLKDGTIQEGMQTTSTGETMNEIVRRLMTGARMHQSQVDAQNGVFRTQAAAENVNKSNSIYQKVFSGFSAQLTEDAAEFLKNQPEVDYIEEDFQVELYATQTSPPSWGLDRIDQRSRNLNDSYVYNATGRSVHLFIIDTGLDSGHPEFRGRVGTGYDFFARDGIPNDERGHGTHVAGTAAGESTGVAKQAIIHPLKVFGPLGSGSQGTVWGGLIIDALEYVLRQNSMRPAVVNMSLGGEFDQRVIPFERAVQRVIDDGIIVVASAGNSNANACNYTPARISDVITVGASNKSDSKAVFNLARASNYGPCVDIVAPGDTIYSSLPRNQDNLTSCDLDSYEDGYGNCSGTSMASPHVAGIAAQYLQTHPRARPSEVSSAIISAATQGTLGNFPVTTANRFSYNRSFGSINQPDIVATAYVDSNKMACAWYYNGTVSCGSTTDLNSVRRPYRYSLAPGYGPEDIVDIAWVDSHHMACAFYRDNRVSCGATGDLDSIRTPYRYTLQPGQTPDTVVGIAYLTSQHRACAWYDNGTSSCGTTGDLDSLVRSRSYTLPFDYIPQTVEGVAWVNHRSMSCAWYSNGKVSCGSPTNLSSIRQPANFKRLEP
jgi:aqualysin 1